MRIHLTNAPGVLSDTQNTADNVPDFKYRGESRSFRYSKRPIITTDQTGIVFTDPDEKHIALSISPKAFFETMRKGNYYYSRRHFTGHLIAYDHHCPKRRIFLPRAIWRYIDIHGSEAFTKNQARNARKIWLRKAHA